MKLLSLMAGVLFVSGLTVAGCGGSDGSPVFEQGALQGACFPNGTCNAGLVCRASVCVAAGDASAAGDAANGNDATSPSDGATNDTGVFNDAGLPCPGATINHPSDNETRGANTQVPFVGGARDATCKPIEGQNLAWDDNGTPIGTGASFNYSFTTKGTRTITLTATDGGSKYKATISLTIN